MLPRWRHLGEGDIAEKKPGDLVTVADRACEQALTNGLTALLPGSTVVGEEAYAADPGIRARLAGDAPVWIIDPIDGTSNFVDGSERFVCLVALAWHGRLLRSWTYHPVTATMYHAAAGAGAFREDERIRLPARPHDVVGMPAAVPSRKWRTGPLQAPLDRLMALGLESRSVGTSGLAYVEAALGLRPLAVLAWDNVWDHAAGLLLHAEAGGVARLLDGGDYDLVGPNRMPLIVGPDSATVNAVAAAMAGSAEQGLGPDGQG